ncbi:hypothetical protein ACFL4J_00440 [Candidatus Margulisiibacteriota bacterium]
MSQREKNLAILTLGFGIFYIFYQFLMLPLLGEVSKLNAKAINARTELKIAEGKAGIVDSLKKNLSAREQAGVAPDEVLSDDTREQRALIVLRSLARATSRSKLNLILIRPLIVEAEGYRFELTCSGSYRQLYDFLELLGDLGILVLVDSMNVSGGGVRNPLLHVKMTLTAYY